ncbi:helix-turn-helix transcriptional regulator [Salmonella enterica]|uniref:ArsR family transcriptional regulator n=1 Tax=Salmonella enterica TaxID=28901 RepID=A0A5T3R4V2_SALER|nr:helix-turn-helix domain-containing protein [Salmonella enterica]EAN6991545.1 ArsR family transcriptional regulator [Salmonella enterica]ECX9440334.1 helix-turn-helix transcriptional regulator [Salmonella enterica]EDX4830040.1 helix-turn-helix transcriptional regulator [Salmonella enterica subsp. enterica serovar Norwich]EGD6858117.1 helix-turn-helix transcriptional regulator [Salmonella enterica]
MNKQTATTIFESLSSGVRLDVYRLLIKMGTEGMVAGEIASTLDIPPTNLSFHLKALTQAGMLTVEQEGRYQRYRANIPLMLDLIGWLTEECCSGHPEQCADFRSASSCSEAVLPPTQHHEKE